MLCEFYLKSGQICHYIAHWILGVWNHHDLLPRNELNGLDMVLITSMIMQNMVHCLYAAFNVMYWSDQSIITNFESI